MAGTAEKKNPKLWERVKKEVTAGDKGGKPGQWSARKAQLAVHEYKDEGGEYKGAKAADNHLSQWTREEWGTRSGKESGRTGERYLPRKARETLSDDEYKRTSAKKRADAKRGKQFSAQPQDVARKTSVARATGKAKADGKAPARRSSSRSQDLAAMTRTALLERARERDITGRSRMRKAELVRALGG